MHLFYKEKDQRLNVVEDGVDLHESGFHAGRTGAETEQYFIRLYA